MNVETYQYMILENITIRGTIVMTRLQKRRIKRLVNDLVYTLKLGIIILLPFVLMFTYWLVFGYIL